jgi:hypothetical protein
MGAIVEVVALVVLRIVKLLIEGFGVFVCLYHYEEWGVVRRDTLLMMRLLLYIGALICDYQGQMTIAGVPYRQLMINIFLGIVSHFPEFL